MNSKSIQKHLTLFTWGKTRRNPLNFWLILTSVNTDFLFIWEKKLKRFFLFKKRRFVQQENYHEWLGLHW